MAFRFDAIPDVALRSQMGPMSAIPSTVRLRHGSYRPSGGGVQTGAVGSEMFSGAEQRGAAAVRGRVPSPAVLAGWCRERYGGVAPWV
jgi:hypothetical protein